MRDRDSLTPELRQQATHIEGLACARGLDFFDVCFEMLDAKDVNAMASYGGFPVRYPSWRFGMDYERLEKGYRYGLSKIYELVINNDPVVAYLVRANSTMEQKLVMAHVFGHADFFKHNVWFQPTERHMLNQMADHGTRIRRYIDMYGQDRVDVFLDGALCLDTLIDPFLPLRRHLYDRPAPDRPGFADRANASLDRVASSSLDASQATQADRERPELPTYDILGVLAERAPLEGWQRDILRIVRAEAYYFVPQRMTKIMNEGWASFWHSRMLTGGILGADEIIEFADCHSGATAAAPGQLNPYKLGIELYRYAEEKGLDIFRLRRIHNDVSFVDELVDEEFASRNQLFVYGQNQRTGRAEVVERGWVQVKQKLLQELAWGGLPQIRLVDDDFEGRGELLLEHTHDDRDLQLSDAGQTLRQVAKLWGRPAHLITREGDKGRRVTSDGETFEIEDTDPPETEEGNELEDTAREAG